MIYHVSNFYLTTVMGKIDIRIELYNGEVHNLPNKYLDYFIALTELNKSGINITNMDYKINDENLECMDSEVNRLLSNKHNELFGGYNNKQKYIKCLKILEM